jgi:hypothetical protein
VRLIDKQGSKHILLGIDKRSGTLEQIRDIPLLHGALDQLHLKHIARGTVLCHIGTIDSGSDQLDQQIDRHYRLARSGASFDDEHPFAPILIAQLRTGENTLEHDLLLIDKHELPLTPQHSGQGILQALRWPDITLFDIDECLLLVSSLDELLDKLLQLFCITPTKHGSLVDELLEMGEEQRIVRIGILIIMQIGAGIEMNGDILDIGIEITDQRLVAEGLVCGMYGRLECSLKAGPYPLGHFRGSNIDKLLDVLDRLHFAPLLQLDNHRMVLLLVIQTGNDEIDPFGALWDRELDRYTGIHGDIGIMQDLGHVHHGVLPGPLLAYAD